MYAVEFYDACDGWTDINTYDKGHLFKDQGEAFSFCREKQKCLDDDNKRKGEHWGVLDLSSGDEIFCISGEECAPGNSNPHYAGFLKEYADLCRKYDLMIMSADEKVWVSKADEHLCDVKNSTIERLKKLG